MDDEKKVIDTSNAPHHENHENVSDSTGLPGSRRGSRRQSVAANIVVNPLQVSFSFLISFTYKQNLVLHA
jgi:hypothetical protein